MAINYPHRYDDDFINTIKKMIDVINDRGEEILSEEAFQEWLDNNNFKVSDAVATYSDLPTSPELKEVRGVIDENKVFMYDGTEWKHLYNLDYSVYTDLKVEMEGARGEFPTLDGRLNDYGDHLDLIDKNLYNDVNPSNIASHYTNNAFSPTTTAVAFPTVEKFNDVLYVAVRAGTDHLSFDGVIRIKTSTDDGMSWSTSSTVVLSGSGRDYRDPQLIVFNNQLVLRAFYRQSDGTRKLVFITSSDGTSWSNEIVVDPPIGSYAGASGSMMVRNGVLISTAYTYPHPCSLFMITTTDLQTYHKKLVMNANEYGYGASESTLEYLEGAYRMFCRYSPEGEGERFTLRLDDQFNIQHIQKNRGSLGGPRSLPLDDRYAFLTYRDQSNPSDQKILIAKTNRLGEIQKDRIMQSEGSRDAGYLDLKRYGDTVYGVYYEKLSDDRYRVPFVKYSFEEIKDLAALGTSTITTFNGNNQESEDNKVAVGNAAFTHDSATKSITVSLITDKPINSLRSVNTTLRTASSEFFITNLKDVELNNPDGVLRLTYEITNISQTTSGKNGYLYYTVLYN